MSELKPDARFDPTRDFPKPIAADRMVIVTDDEDRENEGDLVMAAEKATPECINVMFRHAGGLICVRATASHLRLAGSARW